MILFVILNTKLVDLRIHSYLPLLGNDEKA